MKHPQLYASLAVLSILALFIVLFLGFKFIPNIIGPIIAITLIIGAVVLLWFLFYILFHK